MSGRVAVILFNLGGPDTQDAVRPFLQNLFSDPAILRVPAPLRWLLARFIAWRRAPVARDIYAKMGGASPILINTEAQARALEAELGDGFKCFIVMRYWYPFARDVIRQIRDYDATHVVTLPLYPQFSSTTTASSNRAFWVEWALQHKGQHFTEKTSSICCYPVDEGFITAQAALIRPLLEEAARQGQPRLLLSAHGLPEKVIRAGDPYQRQCEQTARAIVAKLDWPGLDWLNCYQSRVGPLQWITPATGDEIRRAGTDKVPVVVAPISFVSEHAETLVELDIDYAEQARAGGVPFYSRVPAVGAHPDFIRGLAQQVREALAGPAKPRLCPPEFKDCPCRRSA